MYEALPLLSCNVEKLGAAWGWGYWTFIIYMYIVVQHNKVSGSVCNSVLRGGDGLTLIVQKPRSHCRTLSCRAPHLICSLRYPGASSCQMSREARWSVVQILCWNQDRLAPEFYDQVRPHSLQIKIISDTVSGGASRYVTLYNYYTYQNLRNFRISQPTKLQRHAGTYWEVGTGYIHVYTIG